MKRCSNEHLFLYLQVTSHCILNEHYLHLLWRTKRIPFHRLHLCDGTSIQLLSTGTYNAIESGPDFSCAQIKIDDVHWVGNVELHVRSSDWYAHGHHQDPAYNNVILHVVLIHDKEVIVHGQALPTLELKSIIDAKHLEKYKPKKNVNIPCGSLLRVEKNLPFFSLVAPTLAQRLTRKSITLGWTTNGPMEWFYSLIARSFGAKVNEIPFELITTQVPWNRLKTMESNERFALIIQASGLYPVFPIHNPTSEIIPIESYLWKRKGQHAYAQPEKRLVQFAAFVSHLPEDVSFAQLDASGIVNYFTDLLKTSFSHYGILHQIRKSYLLNTLLINAVVPLLYHLRRHSTALALVESIGPEDNHIIRHFRDIGVSPRNAGESQMLLELHGQFCSAKKCLNCAVGTHILLS